MYLIKLPSLSLISNCVIIHKCIGQNTADEVATVTPDWSASVNISELVVQQLFTASKREAATSVDQAWDFPHEKHNNFFINLIKTV